MKFKIIVSTIVLLTMPLLLITVIDKKPETKVDTKFLATVDNPVNSPSGKYQLRISKIIEDGIEQNKFTIFKVINGTVGESPIFTSPDSFRTRDTLYFVWDIKDRIWVYSGDLGTFFWEKTTENKWEKRTYANEKTTTVPLILKELKPTSFTLYPLVIDINKSTLQIPEPNFLTFSRY